MNIGNQIKNLRLEKKVTQEDLASYLKISSQAVSKRETNASTPDITLLPDIATYFGVAIDELFALPEETQFTRIENMFSHEHRIHSETFVQAVRFLNNQITKDITNTRALELNPESKNGWVAFLEANNGICGDEWYDNHFTVIQYFKEFSPI